MKQIILRKWNYLFFVAAIILIYIDMATDEFKTVDPAAVYDMLVFAYQGARLYSKLIRIDPETPDHIITLIRTLLLKEQEEK